MICPKCGEEIPEEDDLCNKCKERQQEDLSDNTNSEAVEPVKNQVSSSEKREKNKALYNYLLIIALAVITIVFIFYDSGSKTSNVNPKSNVSETVIPSDESIMKAVYDADNSILKLITSNFSNNKAYFDYEGSQFIELSDEFNSIDKVKDYLSHHFSDKIISEILNKIDLKVRNQKLSMKIGEIGTYKLNLKKVAEKKQLDNEGVHVIIKQTTDGNLEEKD